MTTVRARKRTELALALRAVRGSRWLGACAMLLALVSAVPLVSAQPAPTATEAAPKRGLPDRLKPMDIVLAEGSRLGVGLAMQARLNVNNTGGTLTDSERDTDGNVELRRVRLSLRGSFLDDRLRCLGQLSFAPGNPELIDLWVEYAPLPAWRVRVGQTKLPFTRHRGQSFAQLPLTEWDTAAVEFGAERQIGLLVHDGMRGDGHLNYSLGVFAGPSARPAFARGVAHVYSETIPNRSSLRTAPVATQLHPEIAGLVGYSSRGLENSLPTDAEGGAPRVFAGVSAAVDTSPEQSLDFTARFAPELLLKLYHVTLDLVGYGGVVKRAAGGNTLGMLGVTGELSYRFHARFEVAARYSRVNALAGLRTDARTRADETIANASTDELEALTQQYANAGRVRAQEEIAVGFNVYVIGRNLALQSDFGLVRDDLVGEANDRDQLRFRAQLQFML